MSAIADHVWQSTWFALAAWLFALLLHKDRAKLRSWIWAVASIKFLFPFALLAYIGQHFAFAADEGAMLLPAVKHVASPLASAAVVVSRVSITTQWLIFAIWAPGCALFLQRLLIDWIESGSLVSDSTPCSISAPVEVRSSRRISAPCVIGVLNPVLLVPEHIYPTLTERQLQALIAHEMGHVRRNDNLIGYLHAFVQALFWFHPLVWIIGAQLAREREHACDEWALDQGHEPIEYAATLVHVCKQFVASDRVGVAHALSGDLCERVRAVLVPRAGCKRSAFSSCVLIVGLIGSVALPIASGMQLISASDLSVMPGTRSIHISGSHGPSLLVLNDRYVFGRNVSLRELIGRACAVNLGDVSGELRDFDHPKYDVEIRASADDRGGQRQLVTDLIERRFNVKLVIHNVGSN